MVQVIVLCAPGNDFEPMQGVGSSFGGGVVHCGSGKP